MTKYSKLRKKLLANPHCEKPNDNSATIYINITNSNEIFSPYAEDNRPVINSEFADFLENAVKDEPSNQPVNIKISSANCDLNTTSTAIKNYYYNEFIDTQRKLTHNLFSSILTLIIGLLALSATITLSALDAPFVVGGAVDIFAWVFIWESVDSFFLRRVELRHSERRQMNFITAKISLINPKSNTSKPSKKPLK